MCSICNDGEITAGTAGEFSSLGNVFNLQPLKEAALKTNKFSSLGNVFNLQLEVDRNHIKDEFSSLGNVFNLQRCPWPSVQS